MFFVKRAFFILLVILTGTLRAFEIDGFKSGMTVVDAELHAKAMGLSSSGSKDSRYFRDITSATGPRFYGLIFCEGRLVNVQKHLKPRFDVFTRLVSDLSQKKGSPTQAWVNNSDATSTIQSSSVTFAWKQKKEYTLAEYIQFPSNSQVSVTYEDANSCWKPFF